MMGKRIALFLTILLFLVASVMAQDVPVGVIVAFKKGSSQELNKYLGDNVELVIQSSSTASGKVGAEEVMSQFFADNKVNGFNVNHQGKRDDSSFVIGTLNTAKGTFRVNCFFRRVQNKYIIHQIRIDKTND
jgi:hypothetical protein